MRNFTITIGASELATVWTDPDFATRGYSNVARPEFGSDWQLRFQIQFLFPK